MKEKIRAKSNGETLEQHTINCLAIFSELRKIFPGIDRKYGHPTFYDDVFDALFFHDFGKSASGFQHQLCGGERWKYRHEILSSIFAEGLEEADIEFVKCLILTHHKDIRDLKEYFEDEYYIGTPFSEHIREMEKYLPSLSEFIDRYPYLSEKYLGKKRPCPDEIDIFSCDNTSWESIVRQVSRCLRNDECKHSIRHLGLFGKGFVNACDFLASAGVQSVQKPLSTLDDVFTFPSYTSVQKRCKTLTGDAIVISPTGSGKTEAALLWATHNLHGEGANRIFYSLPYTASINAMYRRLIDTFSPIYGNLSCVSLLHGKSAYYLYKLYDTEDFSRLKDVARKIHSPYKVMTPFQSLSHFFSLKGYEMGILEMLNGLFIFDEIHSYDARTVGLILAMCEFIHDELDGKMLLMSATLPEFILNEFKNTLDIEGIVQMSDSEIEHFTRHRCTILDGVIFDHLDTIRDHIRRTNHHDRGGVLVVCNTVQRAQNIYNLLQDETDDAYLLHSRFILKDRELIEQKVKDAKLLVGTQTVEVSLDIDYDICFTEPAPLDALIQRFGRVNRRRRKDICDVYVFSRGSDFDTYIYDNDLVSCTIDVLSEMEILRERDIRKAIDKVYSHGFGKHEDIFNQTRDRFRQIIREIAPFQSSKRSESDFYQLFQSYEAVPEMFRTQYVQCLEEKRVFDALGYVLPISQGLYNKFKKEGRLSTEKDANIVDAGYDRCLGLLPDEKTDTIL